MTTLEVVEVDPRDDEQYAAFHAAYWDGTRHDLGDLAPAWTAPEVRVLLLAPPTRLRHSGYVARLPGSGVVVGAGTLALPLHDNLHRAELEVAVPGRHRRRGVGSSLLAHLERLAASAGRRTLDIEATWPHDLGPTGAGWPGVEFAAARGYALALGDVRRRLDLPVDPDLLARLAAEAAPHHAEYELRSWVGPVPDELAASRSRLGSTLMTEAPTGEREIEPEAVSDDLRRANEELLARQGRTRLHTVALDHDGEVVGLTDLVTTVHEPGRVYQWGTLVHRDHRGHRLGLALKVANLRQLQREAPEARELTTFNAEVNTAMIGVNQRLGFYPVARLGEFTRALRSTT